MKITTDLKQLPQATLKLTITVSWSEIKKVYQKVLEKKAKEIEISGFRKGKAPLPTVKEKIGKDIISRETLQEILPEVYAKAVQEHNLKPIVQPKIKVIAMEEDKDWQLEATTCEKPKISLGEYRKEVKNGLKSAKIWVPGKDEEKEEKEKSESERLRRLIQTLLKVVKIELPQILIEDETNRLLSSLLNQIEKLGLTLDTYLNSIKKTVEQLRKEYQERAERTLKTEFILGEIADDLKIQVEDKEIEEMVKKTVKDKKERKEPEINKYYLASILRRQKTLDKLLNL